MEIRIAINNLKKAAQICILMLFLAFFCSDTVAQVYTVKDGKLYIELKKNLADSALDSFIKHFELSDLALKYFIKTNVPDSLNKLGWKIEKNNAELFSISKSLFSSEDLTNVATKIIFTSKDPSNSALFPAINNGQVFGYNRFRKKYPFAVKDSLVTFYLRNNQNWNTVNLVGSFSNWEKEPLPMTKTDSGWIVTVKLAPGKYWYKFIADGKWMLDDDNQQRENDDRGNTNSVYFKTNYLFTLDAFTQAKKIYLAGSFNNWNPKETMLQRTTGGWELPVYLANGTHTYKFVIDGDWKTDPGNPNRFPNEFNDYNSVINLGKPFIFALKGYENAQTVVLTGTFNYWRKDELFMKKSADCWELPYTLGAGNYEYRFIVDGKEITDPDNPVLVNNNGNMNSYLILEPNHTFRLKGYPNAKKVYLAGNFNNFTPNSILMKKVEDEWQFTIHLSSGKHIYKFIVDGEWIRDPANNLWEQNDFKTGDSVIWIGEK